MVTGKRENAVSAGEAWLEMLAARRVSPPPSLFRPMQYSPLSSMALEAVPLVLGLGLDDSSKSPELSSYGEVK